MRAALPQPPPVPAEAPPAPGDRPLEVEAEVHDRHQLELRFNYALAHSAAERKFHLEAYIFVPRNVGVSAANYSRDTFYADATALMRLDALPLPLDRLADPGSSASPLHALSAAVEAFRKEKRPPPSSQLAMLAKLYAYLFTSAVHQEVAEMRGELLRAFSRGAVDASIEDRTRARLARAREALWAFRRVRGAFWPFEMIAHQSFADALRTADEYMSLFLEERLAGLAHSLGREPRYLDGTGRAARVRVVLMELLREEARYRAKYGYLTLGEGDLADDGEYFTYRLSLLKKAVHQALYLDARTSSQDTFLRNAVGAVGAALAAIWALLATPLPATFASFGSGARGLFFVGAVLAYVMKDRTKALTNEYLTRRLRKYDHVFEVQGASLEAMGLSGLRVRLAEAMSFLSGSAVPPEIRALRVSRRTVQLAEAGMEEVIRYRKELTVERLAGHHPGGEGFRLRDILRLNLRHFLTRLDDPLDQVVFFDASAGAVVAANLPKVYHLNLVLRLSRSDAPGQAKLERYRVVINKDGIVRLDRVEERDIALST